MREKNPLETLIAKEELLAKLKYTKFQRVLLKYMHVSDCNIAVDQWDKSWEFCPVCGARESDSGLFRHLDRTKDAS